MNDPDDIMLDTLKHTLDRHAQALQPEQVRRLQGIRRQVLQGRQQRPWLMLRWAGGGLAVTCMTLLLASGSGQTWTAASAPAVAQKQVDPQMLDDMSMLMVIGEDHEHAS